MSTLSSISRHIETTTFRLDDLARRAGMVAATDRPLLEESLAELSTTLEELRISAEELRSQAEQFADLWRTLEAELQHYRELFRLGPDPYLVTDAEGVIREANLAVASLLGVWEDYLPGKPLGMFVPEEDRRAFRQQLPWLLETERLSGWGLRLAPRGRTAIPVEVSVSAGRDPLGLPCGLRWAIRDLTGRKPAGEVEGEARCVRPPREPGRSAAEWNRAFLAEAGKAVDPSSRSAVAALTGLLRDSLAVALYLGHLREGDRLPGIREVARATGLNHKGVARAYRQLVTEGVMEVRDRSGVYVARQGWSEPAFPGGTAQWLTEVLTGAWERRIDIPALPELIRRRTAAVRLRCACVEASTERRASLCRELETTFGLEVIPVALEELSDRGWDAGVPAETLRDADLVVTTPFHAGGVRALARALGKPLMVATSRAEETVGAEEGSAPSAPLPLSPETARRLAELLVQLNAGAEPAAMAAD
ncbi:MAG TPA: PAS domain-containing protein [Longimicrobiaceae bacterium]|nr:PAS domain-containing protein [Longimicrobiaceae bacterium]